LAGAFVRFAAFEVPGVSSAFLGKRALSRLRHFSTTLFKSPTETALGGGPVGVLRGF
jgi:hypothetical protein